MDATGWPSAATTTADDKFSNLKSKLKSEKKNGNTAHIDLVPRLIEQNERLLRGLVDQKSSSLLSKLHQKPEKCSQGMKFKQWLVSFENYADNLEVSDGDRCPLLLSYLHPEQQFRVTQLEFGGTGVAYDTYRKKLIEEFDKPISLLEAEIMMEKKMQSHGESFRDFARSLQEIVNEAFVGEDVVSKFNRQQRVKVMFLRGLKTYELRQILYRDLIWSRSPYRK